MPCEECALLLDENIAAQMEWRSRVLELEEELGFEREEKAELQRQLDELRGSNATPVTPKAAAPAAQPQEESRTPSPATTSRVSLPSRPAQVKPLRGQEARTRSPPKPQYTSDAAGTPALIASIHGLLPQLQRQQQQRHSDSALQGRKNASPQRIASPSRPQAPGADYVDVDSPPSIRRRSPRCSDATGHPADASGSVVTPPREPVRRGRMTSPSAPTSPGRAVPTGSRQPPSFAEQWVESQTVVAAATSSSSSRGRRTAAAGESRKQSPPRPQFVMSPTAGPAGPDRTTAAQHLRRNAGHSLCSPAMD